MLTVLQACQAGCDSSAVKGLSDMVLMETRVVLPGVLVPITSSDVIAAARVNLYLQRPAADSVHRAVAKLGRRMEIISAGRTCIGQFFVREQYELGAMVGKPVRCGVPLAAPVGGSNHEKFAALDIRNMPIWRPVLVADGWLTIGAKDPTHIAAHAGIRQDVGRFGVIAFQRVHNRHSLPSAHLEEDGICGPATLAALGAAPAGGWV